MKTDTIAPYIETSFTTSSSFFTFRVCAQKIVKQWLICLKFLAFLFVLLYKYCTFAKVLRITRLLAMNRMKGKSGKVKNNLSEH